MRSDKTDPNPDPKGLPGNTSDFDIPTEGQSSHDARMSQELSRSGQPGDVKPSAAYGSRETQEMHRSSSAPRARGYRCLRELGRGTFGEVWLAEDETTGVKVAIKFLTAKLGQQWQLLQAEVKQLALFQEDPGIVQLKDFDPDAPRPFYVMAYAEAGSLAQRLKEGPLPLAKALPMFRRIAEAMAYVHARGIRHCDLKPGNILLDSRDRPRVADFGQAHLASDMSPALGTFFYMAPEQADLTGQVPGTRWDVYGLGALFYAMITGRPPHDDSTLREELERTEKLGHRLNLYRAAMARAQPLHAHREVSGMDAGLISIIDRCLAVDPAKRFASAEVVVAALNNRDRNRRQKPILYAGLIAPIVLLAVLGIIGFLNAQHALSQSTLGLEEQAKQSYSVAAHLAAAQVERKMEALIQNVVTSTREEKLIEILQNDPKSQKSKDQILALLKHFTQNASQEGSNPVVFYSLFDDKGFLLGIFPPQEDLLNQNFAWRSYFNGGEDDWDAYKECKKNLGTQACNRDGNPYRPISDFHITHPFKSVDINSKQHDLVGLAAPVRNSNLRIVGVVAASLRLPQFNSWLQPIQIPGGFAAMIDDKFNLLRHKSQDAVKPTADFNPKKYKCDFYAEVFNARPNQGSAGGPFEDPVVGESYLAGYLPIEFDFLDQTGNHKVDRKWGVLVQVEHAKVIQPAKQLRDDMVRWGAIMLTVALLLVVGMWLGLVWLMRREERLGHG